MRRCEAFEILEFGKVDRIPSACGGSWQVIRGSCLSSSASGIEWLVTF